MSSTPVEELKVSASTIRTESAESDGTSEWNATTIVIVSAESCGEHGIGYSYADTSTAQLIEDHLKNVVVGRDAMSVSAIWASMVHSIRNLGRPGICSMAISAVDTALWDLKARLLEVPLVRLFGQMRPALPIYGSGGFTTYSIEELQKQLGGWSKKKIPRVKMKIGRDAAADVARVAAARAAIGDEVELFVDANGAYSRKQAVAQAEEFAEHGVTWFEEPVSSDDLEGLRFIRDHAPAGMEIAAGEYGYDLNYFRRMLDAGAIDVLQADATRCAGFTGFLQVAALCDAYHIPLSAHCAPALHLHIGCAVPALKHAEYFYDHVRIEKMLFDGVMEAIDGVIRPDPSRSGMGLELKKQEAERYRVR
jgi:L-alanine-DL-glutamate epimerase-like enolase superfamily enzyme